MVCVNRLSICGRLDSSIETMSTKQRNNFSLCRQTLDNQARQMQGGTDGAMRTDGIAQEGGAKQRQKVFR